MSRIYKIGKIFRIFSRSGDRELQGPVSRRRGDRGGQAPALRGRSISLYTVGRGPVPRQRRTHRKHRDAGGLSYRRRTTPLCRSRSPDLDPFAIRRSRTTGAAMHRPLCRAGSPDPARTATKTPAKSWTSWKSCFVFRSVRTLMSIDVSRHTAKRSGGP